VKLKTSIDMVFNLLPTLGPTSPVRTSPGTNGPDTVHTLTNFCKYKFRIKGQLKINTQINAVIQQHQLFPYFKYISFYID